MSEIQLKPCPFCGADAQLYVIPYGAITPLYDVECTRCSARIGRTRETFQASKGYLHFKSEQEAAEAWNKRAEPENVVHAHWNETFDYTGTCYAECSRCGLLWWIEEGTAEENEMFYCPKCGAKMD